MSTEVNARDIGTAIARGGFTPALANWLSVFRRAGMALRMILEKAVGRTSIAQALDSLGYMKKMLITNKVTTHFFITPFKSTSYTLHALPTAFSRMICYRWLLISRNGMTIA